MQRKLRKKPMTVEDLAEIIARTMASKEDLKRFATKVDFEIFTMKEDMKRFATKEDISDVACKGDIGELRMEMNTRFDMVECRMDRLQDRIQVHETILEKHLKVKVPRML